MNLDTVEINAVVAVVVTQNAIGSPHSKKSMMPGGGLGREVHLGLRRTAHDAVPWLEDELARSAFAIDLFQ